MSLDVFKTAVVRCEHFNAAHRLHNENWSNEKNEAVFGKCNNPNFHGHNYDLEVKVIGFCDEETGYVIDTKVLGSMIQKSIVEVFDHKNYEILRSQINNELELKIKLYETPRNYVEYPY